MKIEIEQLYGVWRHVNGNIFTDITFRKYDEKIHKGFSRFTIYKYDSREIIYEWQGVPKIVNYPDKISAININYIQYTKNKPEYQNIKIWHFTAELMILEFGDGQRIEFKKIS